MLGILFQKGLVQRYILNCLKLKRFYSKKFPFTFFQKDVEELTKLFHRFNIETEVLLDLSYMEIFDRTKRFSKQDEFSDASVSVFVLMAHGGNDCELFTANGRPIKTEDVIDLFDDRNCPNLKGKPKWFIFQVK